MNFVRENDWELSARIDINRTLLFSAMVASYLVLTVMGNRGFLLSFENLFFVNTRVD